MKSASLSAARRLALPTSDMHRCHHLQHEERGDISARLDSILNLASPELHGSELPAPRTWQVPCRTH